MLNFYDFEVFKEDWLVVIINPILEEKTVIVNDREKLYYYYTKHNNEIWVGYNSSNYDQYLIKGLLLNYNAKKINDWIIVDGFKGYQIDRNFNQIRLYNYDVMSKRESLKTLEGFMGNDIQETSVPFDIDRKLTDEELQEVIKYCTHDVEQTMEVFLKRESEFNAQTDLIRTFNLPMGLIGLTQARLAANILKARKKRLYDEWNIRLPETLKLDKYKNIADWFITKTNHFPDTKLNCEVSGVPHVFGWGGLHGAREKYNYTCKDDELFVMADVDQLYPTLMVKYGLLSRAIKAPELFSNILETSLRLKAEKKKKEREPYKRICNITYGAMGDEYNPLYDPLHRKLVCVYGQVLLVDLLEKIEPFTELIQSNTDGILIKIKRKDFDLLDDTVFEWEERTGLKMSFDFYKKIIQKDVNNYVAVDLNGEMKRKGGYVKELDDLDNDLPIVNEAVVNFLTTGQKVEKTINDCNDLKMFQKIVKLSSKYKYAYHNGKKLNEKVFRVFASKDPRDSYIGKQKMEGMTIEKFANTPDMCFIDNGEVNGKSVPPQLYKQWYIDLAIKRVADYGLDAKEKQPTLF